MASSIPAVALVPFDARSLVVRPAEAGTVARFDADALRRDTTLKAETLRQAQRDGVQAESGGTPDGRPDSSSAAGRTLAGNSTPFLAQLLAQDQPAERKRAPFAEAAQAYGRLQEEPKSGFVLDLPQRVDVKA